MDPEASFFSWTFFSRLGRLRRAWKTVFRSVSTILSPETGNSPCPLWPGFWGSLLPWTTVLPQWLAVYTFIRTAAAAAKSLQSCPTLCEPIDGSPPGSPVPGILQARTLEWVTISFSNAWKWKVKVKSLSRVQPSATPWTAAYQVPLSMGFSRQEYWSGVPLPSPLIRTGLKP